MGWTFWGHSNLKLSNTLSNILMRCSEWLLQQGVKRAQKLSGSAEGANMNFDISYGIFNPIICSSTICSRAITCKAQDGIANIRPRRTSWTPRVNKLAAFAKTVPGCPRLDLRRRNGACLMRQPGWGSPVHIALRSRSYSHRCDAWACRNDD